MPPRKSIKQLHRMHVVRVLQAIQHEHTHTWCSLGAQLVNSCYLYRAQLSNNSSKWDSSCVDELQPSKLNGYIASPQQCVCVLHFGPLMPRGALLKITEIRIGFS